MNIIMVLTNGFDPDVRVYKEAKYLVNKGHNVEILCWDRKCEYTEKTEDVLEGIKIKRFHILSQPGTGMKQIKPYLKFISNVKKYLKSNECDFLHCHDFDGIITGILSKKTKKSKLIFDMHEIYNHYAYAKNIFFNIIFKYVLKKSYYIIHVNEEQIKSFKEKYKEKLIFLPNYPEENIYIPIKKENESKVLNVNYIGSLRDYNSLRALAELSKYRNDINIGLYGMGVCFDKLNKEYKNSNVKLYGKYDGIKESGRIYRDTDILYCSYNPEIDNWKNSYPVKFYEAIITLTPIIVSEDTKVGDFVKKYKIGEVVVYNNESSINEAISKIINNYDKYVKNLEIISDNYKLENIILNLDKIFKENNN